MRTAEACHIPGDRMAKAIVLRTDDYYFLAVLPASHRVSLQALREQFGENVDLAAEDEISELFQDCAPGAVPAIGECYGLEMIVDESIDRQPEIYFEGGDHTTLVHMAGPQFSRLTSDARHDRFSTRG